MQYALAIYSRYCGDPPFTRPNAAVSGSLCSGYGAIGSEATLELSQATDLADRRSCRFSRCTLEMGTLTGAAREPIRRYQPTAELFSF
jgi:hypothetical protein